MRLPSGVTDQYIYFVAVDATDFSSRETGLSSFTVYRSRNGAASAVMTTPTINETDTTNMPGVYELLLDEDMTIGSGNDSEEMCFHITHAGMAPVTRTIELYRPKITAGNTLDVTATGAAGIDWGNIENAGTTVDLSATDINLCDTTTTVTNQVTANTTQIEGVDATDQINAACDSSIETYGLDHLVSAAVIGTDVTDNSIVAKLVSSSATADWDTYANTTDSLQATRDHIGDGTNLTEAGGNGDHLTEAGGTGDHLTAVPWNAAWDAEVQSEVADGLTAFFTSSAQLVDDIWDEVLTGGTHNVANSAGRKLRELAAGNVIHEGTLDAATSNTADLETGAASTTDDFYNHNLIVITGGTGAGQVRLIADYAGTGEQATIVPAWTTTPDATSTYNIFPGLSHAQTQAGGYANGRVYISSSGSTSSLLEVDGIITNPIDDGSIANARTVADAENLEAFYLEAGSSITLDQTYDNWLFTGNNYTVALGGRQISNSRIEGASNGVSGTCTGTDPYFKDSSIGAVTAPPSHFENCGFSSTLTVGSAGDFFITHCYSEVAGASSPTIDMGVAVGATNLSVRDWNGGITISNIAAGDVISLDGIFGTVTLNGADGTVEIRGIAKAVTNNLTGSPTVNDDTVKADSVEAILVDTGTTLDTKLNDIQGATFNSSTDSLEAIRDRGDAAWTTGGGGSITDILNIEPLIPNDIDLADTATYRLGMMLYNAVDDLPSTAEITPGTISIDRKAIGGTSWSAVVTDAACSESNGLIYYDEVFDSGTGYAEGDSLRVTFKSQKITVSANDYEISDATGRIFYTSMRQTMRGTDGANTTTPPTAVAIRSEIDSNSTQLAAIVADTNELQTDWADAGRLDAILDSRASQTSVDTVDSNVDAILVDTGTTIPAQISGLNDPTAAAISDAVWDEAVSDHNGAGSFGRGFRQIKEGLISAESTVNDASATTTTFITALTEASDSHYSDLTLMFIDGNLQGQAKPIQSYTGSSKTIVLDEALTEAPANGDGFIILSTHVHPVSQIADGVLDEALSGHTTAGTLGKAVADIETDATAILADTADMQPKLGTPAGASISADIATVDSNVDAILVDTGTTLPASIATIDANVDTAISGVITGAAQTGTLSTTQATTNLSGYADDQLIGRVIIWTSGACEGEGTDITDYANASGLLTFTALTTSPSNGDTFIIQ